MGKGVLWYKMKELADASREMTRKKYLNYELDYAVKGLAKRVKQRDIDVSSKNAFSTYTTSILSQEVIDDFINRMKSKYDIMEQKYCDNNWNTKWKELCDGKTVFQQTCSHFGPLYGIDTKVMAKKIFNAVINNQGSLFAEFWGNILEKLQ